MDEIEELLRAINKDQIKKLVRYLENEDMLKHSYLHYDSYHAGYVEGCAACELLRRVEEEER